MRHNAIALPLRCCAVRLMPRRVILDCAAIHIHARARGKFCPFCAVLLE